MLLTFYARFTMSDHETPVTLCYPSLSPRTKPAAPRGALGPCGYTALMATILRRQGAALRVARRPSMAPARPSRTRTPECQACIKPCMRMRTATPVPKKPSRRGPRPGALPGDVPIRGRGWPVAPLRMRCFGVPMPPHDQNTAKTQPASTSRSADSAHQP